MGKKCYKQDVRSRFFFIVLVCALFAKSKSLHRLSLASFRKGRKIESCDGVATKATSAKITSFTELLLSAIISVKETKRNVAAECEMDGHQAFVGES